MVSDKVKLIEKYDLENKYFLGEWAMLLSQSDFGLSHYMPCCRPAKLSHLAAFFFLATP